MPQFGHFRNNADFCQVSSLNSFLNSSLGTGSVVEYRSMSINISAESEMYEVIDIDMYGDKEVPTIFKRHN